MERRRFIQLGLLATLIPTGDKVWSNQAPTDITMPPGATTGARLFINANGITMFDANNNVVLFIGAGVVQVSTLVGRAYKNSAGAAATNISNGEIDTSITGAMSIAGPTRTGSTQRQGFIDLTSDDFYTGIPDESQDGRVVNITEQVNNPSSTVDTPNISLYNPIINSGKRIAALNVKGNTPRPALDMQFLADNTTPLKVFENGTGNWHALTNPDRIGFGAGSPGAYYYEDVMLDNQVVTSGVSAVLTNLTLNDSQSDYTSAWNLVTGIWTCPENGTYDIDAGDVYVGWVNGSDTGLGIQRNSPVAPFLGAYKYIRYSEAQSNGGAGSFALHVTSKFLQGDLMRVIAVQRTGANQTINPTDLRSTIRVFRHH